MTDPIRAALERLIARLDETTDPNGPVPAWSDSFYAARAALSADGPAVSEGREPASVVGEPSDEELLALMPQQFRNDLATVSRLAAHGAGPVMPGIFRVTLNTGALEFARAVWRASRATPAEGEVEKLARWLELEAVDVDRDDYTVIYDSTRLRRAADLLRQRHPAPPAEGEVKELVAKLRRLAPQNPLGSADPTITRAADLLEQRHPAPVPVAERLPGPGDCDGEGRCWLLTVEDEYPQWRLHSIEGNQPGGATMIWVPVDSSPGVMVDCFYTSHWLPAYALPLPAGEVQP